MKTKESKLPKPRARVKPGSILAFQLKDGRWAYAHYVSAAESLPFNMCELVVIFDYFTETCEKAEDLIGKPWLFGPIFMSPHAAVRLKGWKVIGRLPIPPFEIPTFRWNEGGAWKPGVYHNWQLKFPSHSFHVGNLSPEHLKYELYMIHSAEYVEERTRTGVNRDLKVR